MESDYVGLALERFVACGGCRAVGLLLFGPSRLRWDADSWPAQVTFIERAVALCGFWRAESWW